MPFTPAHAAAALPFRRTRIPVSAMAVGCLTPDLLYFLRLAPRGRFGHTLPGVFLFDLPLALGLYWIWRAYLRPATIAVLVSREEGVRALKGRRVGPRLGLAAVMGSLLGIGSHILWDSFTHRGFWPYRHIAFLRHEFSVPLERHIRGFEVLQQFSSIAGLVILGFWLRRYWKEPEHGARFHLPRVWRGRLILAVVVAIVLGILRGLWGTRGILWQYSGPLLVTEFLVTAMDVLFLEWLAASMVIVYGLARTGLRNDASARRGEHARS